MGNYLMMNANNLKHVFHVVSLTQVQDTSLHPTAWPSGKNYVSWFEWFSSKKMLHIAKIALESLCNLYIAKLKVCNPT